MPAFYYQSTDPKATNFQYSMFNDLNQGVRGSQNNFSHYALYLNAYHSEGFDNKLSYFQ